MTRDYYKTLGVQRNASGTEIRKAFRGLARKHHPDVNPDTPGAQERFKEVNEAYEVLGDPKKRIQYDRFGENWRYADKFTRSDGSFTNETFSRPSSGHRPDATFGAGSVFEGLLGGFPFASRGRGNVRPAPIEVPVELTLEEAYTGVTRTIQIPSGQGRRAKRLTGTIPKGVDTGSRIHVPAGQGMEIYLIVKVRRHAQFQRKGADLYVDLLVPVADTVLGGQQEVPTMNGTVLLTIPQETQNGQSFRLRNKGMPRLSKEGQYGDLFATTKVVLPTGLSEHERDLFRELKQVRKGREA
jgi:curved DNA-binding protein